MFPLFSYICIKIQNKVDRHYNNYRECNELENITGDFFMGLCRVFLTWGTHYDCLRSFLPLFSVILRLNAIQNMFKKYRNFVCSYTDSI